MSAYIIVEVDVHDQEQFARYREMVPDTLKSYGGHYIVRGGETCTLEGDWKPPRLVVIEFDSLDKAQEWHDSEIYREARTLRHKTATSRMVAVDGVE